MSDLATDPAFAHRLADAVEPIALRHFTAGNTAWPTKHDGSPCGGDAARRSMTPEAENVAEVMRAAESGAISAEKAGLIIRDGIRRGDFWILRGAKAHRPLVKAKWTSCSARSSHDETYSATRVPDSCPVVRPVPPIRMPECAGRRQAARHGDGAIVAVRIRLDGPAP